MNNKQIYRQGDVLIERVEEIPTNATIRKGAPILAYGEATGHHHSVEDRRAVKVMVRPAGNKDEAVFAELFLNITAPTRIVHQEHSPINLAPGKYRVIRQREYSPAEIRRVED